MPEKINPGLLPMVLWDLGYHASDRNKIIQEYNMTEEQADAICAVLQRWEEQEDIGL